MGKDWDKLGTTPEWVSGGGFQKPGIGERDIGWPAFSGHPVHGTANPTCAVCGGRLRGKKQCSCDQPHGHWKPLGPSRGKQAQGETPLPAQPPISASRRMQAWHEVWLRECYRILKPGGVIKAFGATRTFHRLAAGMEAVGFVLPPKHSFEAWAYGCLTEDTEILTREGWTHYHRAKIGTDVLGFDPSTEEFSWQPVEETFEYPYDREGFLLQGEGTEQFLSHNHRALVWRGGDWKFVRSQNLRPEEIVPCVRWGEETGKPNVQSVLCKSDSGSPQEAPLRTKGGFCSLCGVREAQVVSECLAEESGCANVFSTMQRDSSWQGMGEARIQGDGSGIPRRACGSNQEDDRLEQPGMEGWGDVSVPQGQLQTNQVRPLPYGVSEDGSVERLCCRASTSGGTTFRPGIDAHRDGSSCESRLTGQQHGEPNAVCLESGPQAVRASRATSPALVRVPVKVKTQHLLGKVWCVRVSTGAFVARRRGLSFVTGNSGFPKSLNVSKALDKQIGASPSEEVAIRAYLKAQRELLGLSKADVDQAVFGGTTRYGWVEGRGDGYASYLPTPEEWVVLKEVLQLDDRYDTYIETAIPSRENRARADGGKAEVVGTDEGDFGYQKDGERWDGERVITAPLSEMAQKYDGYGTALKPAWEPFVVGRKPSPNFENVNYNVEYLELPVQEEE